jgi:hypothetical protein
MVTLVYRVAVDDVGGPVGAPDIGLAGDGLPVEGRKRARDLVASCLAHAMTSSFQTTVTSVIRTHRGFWLGRSVHYGYLWPAAARVGRMYFSALS